MKILLAEKGKNLISALLLVLTHIKNTEVKEIGLILNVDNVDSLNRELKKEKPDILIINGGFVDHITIESVLVVQELYPAMKILILSFDPGMKKKYLEAGVEDFIIKGDSAEKFYNSLVSFLKKEQKRLNKIILSTI
jgi:response regulator of citrate/malate metabolism